MPIPHFDLGCITKWHGIEKGMALNEKEVDFVVASIIGWIGGQVNEKRDLSAGEKFSNSC